MPFNGAGVFSRTPGTRIANQGALVSAQVNDETDNLVNGINAKVNLDGLLPMTGLQLLSADGTNVLHAATVKQAQNGVLSHATAVGGTVDAIQVTMSPANTTLTTRERLRFTSAGANTIPAPTLSKDGGVTNKTIKKGASAALAVGDTGAVGYECEIEYNGTDWLLLNPATSVAAPATTTEQLTGTDTAVRSTPDSVAALWEAGADVADGAAITIGEGGYFNLITSTTAITSFVVTTNKAGRTFRVRFNTARTLTHNATSLILPGGANITTAQGDIAQFRSLGGGNVVCEWYQKAAQIPGNAVSITQAYTEYDKGAFNTSTSFTQAHGLSALPTLVQVWLECTTIDNGYAVGDRIDFTATGGTNNDTGASTYMVNTTNVIVSTGQVAPNVPPKTGGAPTTLTASSWKIILRVFK